MLLIAGSKRPDEGKDEEKICSACVCELKDCLQEVLSDVLEVEMKAAYEDLWLEVNISHHPLHCVFKFDLPSSGDTAALMWLRYVRYTGLQLLR